jgi:hypothetical protein
VTAPADPAGPGVEPASRAGGRLRRLAVDVTPLRVSPEYRRIWVANGISFMGTQLTAVAVGIQVYDLTGSSAAVGLVGLAALVPLVGLGLVGGAFADSFERRRLALATSSGLAVVSLALVAQAALDLRSVLLLYGLVAVQSALFAVDHPARSTFPPRLLPTELLPAANALSWIVIGFGATVGPLLAGVLVAGPGYTAAYAVDALTFVAPLYSLLRLRPMPPQRDEGSSGRASVRDGLRLLRSRPVLLSTFVADLLAMVFGMPRAVFPELADGTLGGGATTVGVLNAALAAGTMLAAVLSGPTGRVHRQGLGVLLAIAAWGAAIVVFGVSPVLWLACLALAVAGAADTVSAVWRQSVLQAATPDEYRGRLGGVFIVVVAGGPRLGDVRVGGAAALLGPGPAVVGGGLAILGGVALLAALVPRLARYDSRNPQA